MNAIGKGGKWFEESSPYINLKKLNWKKSSCSKRQKVFCIVQASLIRCKSFLRFFIEKNFKRVFLEITFIIEPILTKL